MFVELKINNEAASLEVRKDAEAEERYRLVDESNRCRVEIKLTRLKY